LKLAPTSTFASARVCPVWCTVPLPTPQAAPGSDSFAFAIAHCNGSSRDGIFTLDLVREYKPRFVPAQVIAELAQLCKRYGMYEVYGDKYAIGFHESEWRRHGIRFVACERTTSENYLTLLQLLLAQRVLLVSNATARSQRASLERRVTATDRESVSHPQRVNAHDDLAAAIAGIIGAVPRAAHIISRPLHREVRSARTATICGSTRPNYSTLAAES
jgi:hypothetical protein